MRAAWLELANSGLAARPGNPIDKGLRITGIHPRMFIGVDRNYAVLIVQRRIAFDENSVVGLIPEAYLSRAIG